MAKILLVEDDNNLREIYEARLQAEGYTIVSAHDGEEALVVAESAKPDLIISDVMMPKISGFEMLDILRNTDTLKHVKVIMLTALGQSDDQERANKLGTDRYLVKSQVTLEDIVNVANELLQSGPAAPGASPTPSGPPSTPSDPSGTPPPPEPTATTTPNEPASPATGGDQPVTFAPTGASSPTEIEDLTTIPGAATPTTPVADTPAPQPSAAPVVETPAVAVEVTPVPVDAPVTPVEATPAPAAAQQVADAAGLGEPTSVEKDAVKSQIESFMENQNSNLTKDDQSDNSQPLEGVESSTTPSADDTPSTTAYKVADETGSTTGGYIPPKAGGQRVITPTPQDEDKPDINELLEREKAKEILEDAAKPDEVQTMSAADTAPAPTEPVIAPGAENTALLKEAAEEDTSPTPATAPGAVIDPNSIAL